MIPRLMIVDDEAPARNRLRMLLSDIAVECPHELVAEAASAAEALERMRDSRPDLLLLDVQMPGMTGVALAEALTRQESAPGVIFITAFDDYALQAFEVHALDYLMKPVRAQRLAAAIARAVSLLAAQGSTEPPIEKAIHPARRHFSVPERGRVVLVPVQDVLYCKAEQKYVTLRTRAASHLIEEPLTSIEEEFADHFIRVHRNALVARDAIAGVERGQAAHDAQEPEPFADKGQEGWQVIIRGLEEERLPISRRQWAVVKCLVR